MNHPAHALPTSAEAADTTPPKTPLSSLSAGSRAVVSCLEGEREFMNRVATLGFTVGAQVTVLQNYGSGPLIVSMLGAHIALGRQEAALIQVRPV